MLHNNSKLLRVKLKNPVHSIVHICYGQVRLLLKILRYDYFLFGGHISQCLGVTTDSALRISPDGIGR